ncbi:MAG: lysozyme family protein [Acidimicrobiales bacterium]
MKRTALKILAVTAIVMVSMLSALAIVAGGITVLIAGAVADTGAQLYNELALLDEAGTSGPQPSSTVPAGDVAALVWEAANNCPGYADARIMPALSDLLESIWWTETNFDGAAPGQVDAAGTLVQRYRETSSAGAIGPMQFEPATFAGYQRQVVVPPVARNVPAASRIWNLYWAFGAASRMLCNDGLENAYHLWAITTLHGTPNMAAVMADVSQAVDAYNHSAGYVLGVISQAMIWSENLQIAPPNYVSTIQAITDKYGGNQAWADLAMAVADLTVTDTMIVDLGTVFDPLSTGTVPVEAGGAVMPSASGFSSASLIATAYNAITPLPSAFFRVDPNPQSLYELTSTCSDLGGNASYLPDRHFPGDLVFFSANPTAGSPGPSGANIDHVGVYLGIFSGGPHAGDVAVADVPALGDPVAIEALATPANRLITSSFTDQIAGRASLQTVVAVTNPAQQAIATQITHGGCFG